MRHSNLPTPKEFSFYFGLGRDIFCALPLQHTETPTRTPVSDRGGRKETEKEQGYKNGKEKQNTTITKL
jgi:hypothetical protein